MTDGFVLPINIQNKTIDVLGYFNISLNISNVNITNIDLPQNDTLIELHEGYLFLNLQDLCLNVNSNYSFIMDPPIVADLGNTYIDIENLSVVTNLTGDYQDEEFFI
jgi:hypothetical protein